MHKLLFLLFCSFGCKTTQAEVLPEIRIVSVYDGDTVKVDITDTIELLGFNLPVRLRGVDTPELRTHLLCEKRKAYQAREFLALLLETADTIDVRNCERGKYFRLICDVFANGVNVSSTIIKNGLGVPYDGGTRPRIDWCNETL